MDPLTGHGGRWTPHGSLLFSSISIRRLLLFFLYRCRSVDPLSGKGGRGPPWNFFFFPSIPIRRLLVFLYRCRSVDPLTGHGGGGGGPPFREGGRGPPMNFFFSLNINPTINHFLYRCRSVDPLTGHGGPWTPYVISFCFLRVLLRIQRYCHSFICNGINLIETKLKQQLKLKIVAPSIIDLILS